MAEREELVRIGNHLWVRLPQNVTAPSQAYPESVVRACNGDPALVQQTTYFNKDADKCES